MKRLITIVLLPGMDGTGLLLERFATSLKHHFEVVVARYPADEALDYAALENIARGFLPTDRPFVLLGESFSGPIAISLAATNPPGLVGLVLCCSFAVNPHPLLGKLPLIRWLPVKRAPARLSSWLLMGRRGERALQSAFEQAMTLVAATTLRARVQAVLAVDVSAKLKQLTLPILYLRGTEDRVVPKVAAELIRGLAPHAKIVDLPAPHFLLQVMPDEAASAVSAFSKMTG
jgi:pimeloyl-ACP methyl ester carboxylesterase